MALDSILSMAHSKNKKLAVSVGRVLCRSLSLRQTQSSELMVSQWPQAF